MNENTFSGLYTFEINCSLCCIPPGDVQFPKQNKKQKKEKKNRNEKKEATDTCQNRISKNTIVDNYSEQKDKKERRR